MGSLEYVKGDLFARLPQSNFLITHIVNDLGAWGSGFVVPLAKRFPSAKTKYWSKFDDPDYAYPIGDRTNSLFLGKNILVPLYEECANSSIVHMVAQQGLKSQDNPTPIKYGALAMCMGGMRFFCGSITRQATKTIYAPKFGSDRAGGDWKVIESLINELWVDYGLNVRIFYL